MHGGCRYTILLSDLGLFRGFVHQHPPYEASGEGLANEEVKKRRREEDSPIQTVIASRQLHEASLQSSSNKE
jgi:hypothetical protein